MNLLPRYFPCNWIQVAHVRDCSVSWRGSWPVCPVTLLHRQDASLCSPLLKLFWHVRVSLTWALGPLPSPPRATWDPASHPCPSCCPQQELPVCRNLCPSSVPIFHTGGQDSSLSTTWKQFADYSWGFIAFFFLPCLGFFLSSERYAYIKPTRRFICIYLISNTAFPYIISTELH